MFSTLLKSTDFNILKFEAGRPEIMRLLIPLTPDLQGVVLDYCRPRVMKSEHYVVIQLHDGTKITIYNDQEVNFTVLWNDYSIVNGFWSMFHEHVFHIRIGGVNGYNKSSQHIIDWNLKFLDNNEILLQKGKKKIRGKISPKDLGA